jgi:hypothetical protein
MADLLSLSLTVPGWLAALFVLLAGYLAGCVLSGRIHIERVQDEADWWRRNAMSVLPAAHRDHDGYGPDDDGYHWPKMPLETPESPAAVGAPR